MEQNQQTKVSRSRIRRSAAAIRSILADQQNSNLTVKEYCQVQELSEKTFYKWIRKYRTVVKRKPRKKRAIRAGFASIEVVSSNSSHPQLFAEIGKVRLYKEMPVEYLKALIHE